MSFTPSSPVTGAAVSGLTSPTYTITADTAPAPNAKQYAVTALGGTQTGVDTHSIGKPFTITMFRPSSPRVLGSLNPITGRLSAVPNNVYAVITRKGVVPLSGQAVVNAVIETKISIPAGSDLADLPNLKAMLSLHFGAVWAESSDIADTVQTGIL